MTLARQLRALDACAEAIAWVGDRDLPTAWAECQRGDWLLWLAGRLCQPGDEQHRALVRAACAIVRTVLHRVPAGEDRPRLAIEAAEAWAEEPTPDRATASDAANDAASDAASDAAWAAASDAARAAARAAHADIVRRLVPMPVMEGGAS